MKFKIIVDSCCDLPDEYRSMKYFDIASLSIQVGEYNYIDDENIDLDKLVDSVKESPVAPKSACPSPEEFMNKFRGEAEEIYVVTLSSKLSGSYNSALLAKSLYLEETKDNKKITVIDSKSASAAEVSLALLIYELASQGIPYADVVNQALQHVEEMKTYFVLESLETLRKNGRLNGIQALLVSVLNIKPVMSSNNGEIIKLDQTRGIKKALLLMAEIATKERKGIENKIAYIAHANDLERANFVKEQLLKLVKFKDVVIIRTRGISTIYANDKGIILAI